MVSVLSNRVGTDCWAGPVMLGMLWVKADDVDAVAGVSAFVNAQRSGGTTIISGMYKSGQRRHRKYVHKVAPRVIQVSYPCGSYLRPLCG